MAKLREIDGAYVIDYRRDGRRRRIVVGRVGVVKRAEAEKYLHRVEVELSPAYASFHPKPAPFFSEHVREYLIFHAADYPTSHYRVKQIIEDWLLPTFQYHRLSDITPKMVEKWKRDRLAPNADGKVPKSQTVTKELRTLKAILNKAVEWKDIKESPIEHVSAPKQLDSAPPRWFTKEELQLIYDACWVQVNNGEGPQPNPLHAAMWKLYANTGMRRAEGLILKRKWVGYEAMKIVSTEESRTKSAKWRDIPLSDAAREALYVLPKGEYVLPRMTLPSLSRACIHDIRRAGIEDGSLHTMRHTYCSHLVMAGVPLRTVQKLAGHSTIKITENYAHLSPDHLRNAAGAINL